MDVFFACLAAVNVHYGAFDELLKGLLPVKVINKASDQVVKTHHGRYIELVKGLRPSFQVCTDFDTDAIDVDGEDPSIEKDDDRKEEDDSRREDEQVDDDNDGYDSVSDLQPDNNSNVDIAKPKVEKEVDVDNNDNDNSALDAQLDVNTSIALAKPEEVEKGVSVIAKLDSSKIVDLKLTDGLVVNCLVHITFAIENLLPNTFDEAVITLENLLADIIAHFFDSVPSVNSLSIFIIFPDSLIKDGSLTNLMVIQSSIHAAVVPIGSTAEANVIANPYNVGPVINILAPLGPSVAFASSFVEDGSVANLRATNPTVDIHDNSILASMVPKPFTYISIISVSLTIDAGIVSNLFADILSPIKLFSERALNTTYKEWSICTSCSDSVVCAMSWRRQICNCHDLGFLDGIYVFSCVKHISLIVCDYHLYLLASKLYLVDTLPAKLYSQIDLIWKH